MHYMKLVLNIRLVALLVVAVAVLLAASALAPRQASADYIDPTGVLCFQLTELGGNPLPGIGLVRIDLDGTDVTFSSFVYIGTGTPTCQAEDLQGPIPADASPFGAEEVLNGTWDVANHTIIADVCQEDLNFGTVNFAFAKVIVNFDLPVNPTGKLTGTFGLEGPYTSDTCTTEDTGFNSFPVDILSGPYLAGPGGDESSYTHDWDKDGCTDWAELDPVALVPANPFVAKIQCLSGVGGVAELADEAGTPLAAPDSSSSNTGLIAGIVAAIAAGTVTLGGAAWYTRRRSIQ